MSAPTAPRLWLWLALLLACAGLYVAGLGSSYAPTNGDEMVYIHIARMTAESGNWLPLQSEIVDTRNTKPPLLFWQAMVAGDWGQNWSLLALRVPSVVYTFLTVALIAAVVRRMGASWHTVCLSAVLYLLFFSTFRYGRVYLTSAPETFWLGLPMFWLLWQQSKPATWGQAPLSSAWGLGTYTLVGLAMGLGAAYKSFALIAPAAAGLWIATIVSQPQFSWRPTLRATLGLTWSAILALGIFALWFALDPDPAAVWQEFIVAENAGKMSNAQGYWHAALLGAYPMWTQLLAYPENAGLLFFVVLGVCWAAVRHGLVRNTYRKLTPAHWVLLAWLLVWLIVFTIPSQRSARYVIPAMPAMAIAVALLWERIAKPWFQISLLICLLALPLLGRIAWTVSGINTGDTLWGAAAWAMAIFGMGVALTGLCVPAWCRAASLVASLSVYATFGLMVAPLNAPQANYSTQVQAALQGARVAVPNGFTGQFERFHFLLPSSRLTPYDAEGRNTGAYRPDLPANERLDYLLGQFDAVVWLQDSEGDAQPPCAAQCAVLGSRLHIKSRHKSGEVTLDNVWYPEQWLLGREWLLTRNHRQGDTKDK